LTRNAQRAALARALSDEVAAAPGGIGAIHDAISSRVFRALGPPAAPVRVMHDGIARTSYFGVRAGIAVAGRLGERAYARGAEDPPAPLLAALNGLQGDAYERDGSPLAIEMSAYRDGVAVAPEAFAGARRLVVFLHGLGESEYAWGRVPYGSRLEGWTPMYVRYNTGRHISENGASLAALLERVDAPEIALVGHSMGGLVARAACALGSSWTERVTVTVSLGSPHFGAPLEQAVHVASAGLHALPETRPFARFLRRRSAGIRDLRRGSLVDEDWRDQDPDVLRARACAEVPLCEGPTHYFVAATVTRSAKHPVGRLIGDTLVLAPSASGRGKLTFHDGLELGGAHHLALLNHPAVLERLREWLG
jgi:pimeloyl-ACP methyl ester carboxylesterase